MDVLERVASLTRSLERQLNKENYDERLDNFIHNTLIELWDFQGLLENEKIDRDYEEAHEALLVNAQ